MITAILGMHRSGTSLAARVLNLAGMYLGGESEMIPPGPMNPRGFWEHGALLHLNDRLLDHCGGTWYAPPDFPPAWEEAARRLPLRAEARQAIVASFAGRRDWGWKDPRLSLTLPFWRDVIADTAGAALLRCVVCVRNPLDAAASQVAASATASVPIPTEQALALWRLYMESALRNARAEERIVLFYEDLTRDWRTVLPPVLEKLALPSPSVETEAAIDAFIDRGLRHHCHTAEDVLADRSTPLYVKDLYATLRSGPEATDDWLRATPAGGLDPLLPLQLRSYRWETEARRLSSILSSPAHRLVHRLAPTIRRAGRFHALLTTVLSGTVGPERSSGDNEMCQATVHHGAA
jgi:hypothetical protein